MALITWPITLGEARTLLRRILNEPTAALWDDDELNDNLSQAHAQVYYRLAEVNPALLAVRTTAAAYTAGAEAANITIPTAGSVDDYITSPIIRLLQVQWAPASDSKSWRLCRLGQLQNMEDENIGTGGSNLTEADFFRGGGSRYQYTAYLKQAFGTQLYLRPVPAQTIYFRIMAVWAPRPIDVNDALAPDDANPALSPISHMAWIYEAAVISKMKDGSVDQALLMERDRQYQHLETRGLRTVKSYL